MSIILQMGGDKRLSMITSRFFKVSQLAYPHPALSQLRVISGSGIHLLGEEGSFAGGGGWPPPPASCFPLTSSEQARSI